MLRTREHAIDDATEHLIVVSDIHGYMTPVEPFEAARKKLGGKQLVAFNGDLCYGGPRTPEVVRWLQATVGELTTTGNHDETMVLNKGGFPGEAVPAYSEAGAYNSMSEAERQFCHDMPHRLVLKWRGKRIVLMHGHVTPAESYGSWRATPDEQVLLFDDPTADLCVMSHTHYPYVIRRNGRTYANTGSMSAIILGVTDNAGLHPQSGASELTKEDDPRPSYLVINPTSNGLDAKVHRFEYDRKSALRDLEAASSPRMGMLRNWLETGILDRGRND